MSDRVGLRTLILNANYMPLSLFPLSTENAEDAMKRVFSGSCDVVLEYDRRIKTQNKDIHMNWASILVRKAHDIPDVGVRAFPDAESLYYRDMGRCAYCRKELTIDEVTCDHVYPASFGGGFNWDNIVAACSDCNNTKGNALPEGQWAPKARAYVPTYWDLLKNRRKFPLYVDDLNWTDFLLPWVGGIKLRAGIANL